MFEKICYCSYFFVFFARNVDFALDFLFMKNQEFRKPFSSLSKNPPPYFENSRIKMGLKNILFDDKFDAFYTGN